MRIVVRGDSLGFNRPAYRAIGMLSHAVMAEVEDRSRILLDLRTCNGVASARSLFVVTAGTALASNLVTADGRVLVFL